ncbi:hypothetical protein GCM10010407_19420 [Rarobacter incanus]
MHHLVAKIRDDHRPGALPQVFLEKACGDPQRQDASEPANRRQDRGKVGGAVHDRREGVGYEQALRYHQRGRGDAQPGRNSNVAARWRRYVQ